MCSECAPKFRPGRSARLAQIHRQPGQAEHRAQAQGEHRAAAVALPPLFFRQAVALLMATMTPLQFLILDEHTAALDPKTAEIIMELTDKVIREKHLTAMMVTHNLRHAVEYGDRILMMSRGHVVLDRAGEEKRSTSMDDILAMFNQISMECGN